MARQAHIIETVTEPGGRRTAVVTVHWAAVPVGREYIYKQGEPVTYNAGTSVVSYATEAELNALYNGTVAERSLTLQIDPATSEADVRVAVIAAFNAWQAEVNAYDPSNPFNAYWDGTVWTDT